MPDFTATRTFLYVAGNLISPTQNTANELGIYNPFNASINATAGHLHSGTIGDGPLIPIISPNSRVVVGASAALSGTDVYIGMDHTAGRTVTFTQGASTAFKRTVTVYDYTGNAATYPVVINFVGGWQCQGLTSISITTNYGAVTLQYDLAQWNIVNTNYAYGQPLMFSKTLIYPEYIQDDTDFVPLLPIEAAWAPNGIVVRRCGIKKNANGAYSVVFEDWSDPATYSADIATVATGAGEKEKDSGAISVSVAAGKIVGIDLPTTAGVIFLQVWFIYELKIG